MLITKVTQTPKALGWYDANATLTLYRLNKYSCGFRSNCRLKGSMIRKWDLIKALHFWSEAFKVLFLAPSCNCRQGASVKCTFKGYEAIALRLPVSSMIFSSHFDCTFERFSTRICKKYRICKASTR